MMNQPKLHQFGNTLGLVIISLILSVAFIDQLLQHDLPCPLCLLQRIGFIAVGLCLCMNLKNGIKTSHYGLMILSSLLGFFVSLRQISLHTMPNDPGYGSVLFGLHFYVWSAIAFCLIIGLIAIGLLFEAGFTDMPKKLGLGKVALMIFFLFLILANGISTLIECGLSVCPDNPVNYKLLSSADHFKIAKQE